MIGFLLGLIFVWCMLWLGFKLTGALISACIWLFVAVPIFGILFGLGLACCCTIVLIPIGIWLFKVGFRILVPNI